MPKGAVLYPLRWLVEGKQVLSLQSNGYLRLVISSVRSPEAAVPVDGDGSLLDADLLLERQADALQLPLPPLALLQLNSEGWGGRLHNIAATRAVNRTAKFLNAKILYYQTAHFPFSHLLCLDILIVKALVGFLNKEKAQVEAFSEYCETSRSPVSSSSRPHLVLELLHGGLQLGHLLYQPVRRLVAAQLDVGPLVPVGQPSARYLQIFLKCE